ncbi:hypothetical protein EVAR_86684_1 [Eumeta japonica]|uniref:Uncharacterized protein n=1 Tax=Eumeta variegata TaxID=151549 RepID=A0A4C1XW97_EUMVA|nr:hypothetical protein EVAR_86684_1 [Eumeta japonica]
MVVCFVIFAPIETSLFLMLKGRSKSVVMGIMSPSWAGLCPTTAMELEPVLIKPRLCSPTRRLDPPFSLMSFKLALGTTVL